MRKTGVHQLVVLAKRVVEDRLGVAQVLHLFAKQREIHPAQAFFVFPGESRDGFGGVGKNSQNAVKIMHFLGLALRVHVHLNVRFFIRHVVALAHVQTVQGAVQTHANT